MSEPEKVEVFPGGQEDRENELPAIAWMELGGLSVALTRSTHDGKLLVALESKDEDGADVRIVDMMQGDRTIWEGKLRT